MTTVEHPYNENYYGNISLEGILFPNLNHLFYAHFVCIMGPWILLKCANYSKTDDCDSYEVGGSVVGLLIGDGDE